MSEFLEQLGIENLDPMGKDEDQPILVNVDETDGEPVSVDDDTQIVEESVVPKMSEVEKRLQKAVLYQQWANGGLYDQKTDSTIEVEAEFRAFALSQLNKLIGIHQEQEVKSSFTEQEITVLKSLAKTIIENPSLLGGRKTTKDTAKPVQKHAAKVEVQKPVVKPTKPPKLNKQELPQGMAPAPIVVTKPVQQVTTQQVVTQQSKPAVTSQVKKGPQFFKDGETFEEKGKRYEIKWVLTHAGAYGPAEEIRLTNMPQKTCLLLKNGLSVYKTEGDEIYKIIKMDKTPRTMPEQAVPFPRNMTAATIAAAEATASAVNDRFGRDLRR